MTNMTPKRRDERKIGDLATALTEFTERSTERSFFTRHFPFQEAGSGVFLALTPRSSHWVQIKNQKSLINIRYSKEGQPFTIDSAESTKFVPENHPNFLTLPRAVSKAGTGENMLFENTSSNTSSPTISATP